jgi:hypothetical protein
MRAFRVKLPYCLTFLRPSILTRIHSNHLSFTAIQQWNAELWPRHICFSPNDQAFFFGSFGLAHNLALLRHARKIRTMLANPGYTREMYRGAMQPRAPLARNVDSNDSRSIWKHGFLLALSIGGIERNTVRHRHINVPIGVAGTTAPGLDSDHDPFAEQYSSDRQFSILRKRNNFIITILPS